MLIKQIQARSQEFAVGGLSWGQSPQAAGGWGSDGKPFSRRRNGDLEAEPLALANFAVFCKNNLILELF